MVDATLNPTKRKLLDAALETLRVRGIAGTSARSIATQGGVNQALIFYHFGSVDELIDAACRDAADLRADAYRERLGAVASLRELLTLGRTLHAEEKEAGNVTMLAQVLAGGQQEPVLAGAAAYSLGLWVAQLEAVLGRLLAGSPIAPALDLPGLARGVAASFIGIELYDGIDPIGAEAALAALEQLAVLVEVAEDLGPVARRALQRRMRAVSKRRAEPGGARNGGSEGTRRG